MPETTGLSRQDARKLETRQQIQDAARMLIAEHGYEKTTMRMLAKAAGVGLGTISLHFKDKQSLLLASFYDEIGALALRAMKEAPRDKPIRDQILSIIKSLYTYYGTHTLYLRSVVKGALFAKGEWRARFDAQIMETVGVAAKLFDAGKARGEVKPNLDSLAAASAVWSLYISVLIDGLNAEQFNVELQVAKFSQVLDVMLEGVVP